MSTYYTEDPQFRACSVSQCSRNAVVLESDLKARFPHMIIKRRIRGEAKRRALEGINKTLGNVNVFLYNPVVESGVEVTAKVKKLSVLSFTRNSQRAFLQMINRCRCVEAP